MGPYTPVKDLIRRIFVIDPMLRLSISGIKQHPWWGRGLITLVQPFLSSTRAVALSTPVYIPL